MTAGGLSFVFVAALATAALLVLLVRRWAQATALVDAPGARRLHTVPTPRGGGLAIVAVVMGGTLGAWPLLPPVERAIGFALVFLAALVAQVSWWEDRGRLGPQSIVVRLVTQVVAAVLLVVAVLLAAPPEGFSLQAGLQSWLALPVAVFWLVGLTNAFNFMDGIDGMAGSQALCAGLGWALLGGVLGSPLVQVAGVLVAGASLGFLLFNWSPASIFLGDVGSTFLGFTVAGLAVVGGASSGQPSVFWAGVLFVWPFVFDTAFTLCRRAWMRENVFTPHTTHLYQALVRSGLTHSTVSGLYLGLGAAGVMAGLGLGGGFVRLSWWMILLPTLAFSLWAGVRARMHWVAPPWQEAATVLASDPSQPARLAAPPRAAVLAGAVLGVAGLWFTFRQADLTVLLPVLSAVRLWPVVLALLATAGAVALATCRWRVLLAPFGRPPGGMSLARAITVGQMVNILSPVRIGEVARLYALAEREPVAHGCVLATLAVERALDLTVSLSLLVLLVTLELVPAGPWMWFAAAFASAAAALIGVIAAVHTLRARQPSASPQRWFLNWPGTSRWSNDFHDALSQILRAPVLGLAVALTLATVLLGAATNYLLIDALALPLPASAALVVLFSLQIAAILPSLPARIGVFHSATALALVPFGARANEALAYALLLYAIALVPKLVVGLLWLGGGNRIRRPALP